MRSNATTSVTSTTRIVPIDIESTARPGATARRPASPPEVAVRMRPAQRPALGEPLEGIARDVHGGGRAVEDQLRQALADRRRGLEPGPREPARQDEAVGPGTAEDGPLVG